MESRLDLVVNGWRNRRSTARRLAVVWFLLLFAAQEAAFSRLLMARDGSAWPPFGLPIPTVPTIQTDCNDGCRPIINENLEPIGWPSSVGIIVFCLLIQAASTLGSDSARLFISQPLPADESVWPTVTTHAFGAGAANDSADGPPLPYKTGSKFGDVGVHAGTLAELPGSDKAVFIGSVVGRLLVFGTYLRAAICCVPVFYVESLIPMLPAAGLPDVINFLFSSK